MDLATIIGSLAALCTTVCNIPQLLKCWRTGKADDLSLKMLALLVSGVALWLAYGIFKGDWVMISANSASLVLLAGILYFKMRGTSKMQ